MEIKEITEEYLIEESRKFFNNKEGFFSFLLKNNNKIRRIEITKINNTKGLHNKVNLDIITLKERINEIYERTKIIVENIDKLFLFLNKKELKDDYKYIFNLYDKLFKTTIKDEKNKLIKFLNKNNNINNYSWKLNPANVVSSFDNKRGGSLNNIEIKKKHILSINNFIIALNTFYTYFYSLEIILKTFVLDYFIYKNLLPKIKNNKNTTLRNTRRNLNKRKRQIRGRFNFTRKKIKNVYNKKNMKYNIYRILKFISNEYRLFLNNFKIDSILEINNTKTNKTLYSDYKKIIFNLKNMEEMKHKKRDYIFNILENGQKGKIYESIKFLLEIIIKKKEILHNVEESTKNKDKGYYMKNYTIKRFKKLEQKEFIDVVILEYYNLYFKNINIE